MNSCMVLADFGRDDGGSDCDTATFEKIRSLLLVAADGNLTAIWFKRNLRMCFTDMLVVVFVFCWPDV